MQLQQKDDSSDINKGQEGGIGFVIAGGNTAKPLEALKETFDDVAMFISLLIVIPGLSGIRFGRNNDLSAMFSDITEYLL